ncbi:MAG: hypothetical protein COW19_05540 [Zetaproteobacteria bacterium CG12_big_fil_rev_8_21_14_0_65_55_1124]|nr:MAG: hypothetical protein AUJ58_07830 [Zetaproteobacteria bacterium CG1_02_55_237]PIW42901.1 MAG: hypothetical protein COW19_05540 [Zetaproteobacteria bacterium CG12_big_fil_rev_8_21_14_0_65_55_1124]PJB79779.1 MAG: hypothetical protein CO089_09165 [Zetaproteobacteria bacterium CG_4_9_14_0_8_um_filter_55_31]
MLWYTHTHNMSAGNQMQTFPQRLSKIHRHTPDYTPIYNQFDPDGTIVILHLVRWHFFQRKVEHKIRRNGSFIPGYQPAPVNIFKV